MSGPSQQTPGRIFISYRRDDAAFAAGWLFQRLTGHFGEGRVFMDVDSIAPGDEFVRAIDEAVSACGVLLAVIGDRWLSIADDQGGRRLDNPTDLVRLEIEAALTHGVRVIPVLVGSRMPRDGELPASLRQLAFRQGFELSPGHFPSDADRLLAALDRLLTQPAPSVAASWSSTGPSSGVAEPGPGPTRAGRFLRTRTGRLVAAGAVVCAAVLVTLGIILGTAPPAPGGAKISVTCSFTGQVKLGATVRLTYHFDSPAARTVGLGAGFYDNGGTDHSTGAGDIASYKLPAGRSTKTRPVPIRPHLVAGRYELDAEVWPPGEIGQDGINTLADATCAFATLP